MLQTQCILSYSARFSQYLFNQDKKRDAPDQRATQLQNTWQKLMKQKSMALLSLPTTFQC